MILIMMIGHHVPRAYYLPNSVFSNLCTLSHLMHVITQELSIDIWKATKAQRYELVQGYI